MTFMIRVEEVKTPPDWGEAKNGNRCRFDHCRAASSFAGEALDKAIDAQPDKPARATMARRAVEEWLRSKGYLKRARQDG